METGLNSESLNKRGGSVEPKVGPFVPKTDRNPRDLRSWAKRTGFVSDYSGEAGTSGSEKFESFQQRGRGSSSSPKIEIDPVLGRMRDNRGVEIQPASHGGVGLEENVRKENDTDAERKVGFRGNGNGGNAHGVSAVAPVTEEKDEEENVVHDEVKVNLYEEEGVEPVDGGWKGPSELNCGLTENPGFVSLIYYGLQHYLSLAGSLVLIPLVMVPVMGGTDKDTATLISTMLFLSGITTILHVYFGTRLPLVQGSSFVYLAPALVIINAQEYRNLTEHKFRHIMRELQGAIIVGSIFQCILGFSGLMSILLRLINPVVVAPTVAAVGLAFFSYGFQQAGICLEISVPQIALVLLFTLYLRGISIFGRHLFRVYAIPLSVAIVWIYASFLTAGGVYNYKGCNPDIPSSNVLTEACRKHAYTIQHCRTDVSDALSTAAWVRIPYPLQWGFPIFHFRTCIIMVIVSLVASVDSVGTYRTVSLQVNSRPPTPGVVSRGIALEGFCSILAGLWGSGTGSTTLTENVHTINITKVASRKVVELGAVFLILFSFIGKVGALLASIPQALAAAVLCFMWALTVTLGLSTLQYGQSASFRNMAIVGVALFLASSGPFHSGLKQVDFAINALMSMNMVVTLLVAFLLDNTVPGSKQERGVYAWSKAEDIAADASLQSEYSLPKKLAWCCCWLKCLGV
ncbi:nucleobase-ascorbate transporter 11 isoform X2 [Lathyrus oleraceus]|uniref:nucleobase-ascorbate transporter 11 isoform X2 n=1 Tax=Pisum sativum TaxID=3888 RepID=UPI0021D3A30B|nr:nucleobase-ascorbate transporter 11 isoform X2 [Pisum sativum]